MIKTYPAQILLALTLLSGCVPGAAPDTTRPFVAIGREPKTPVQTRITALSLPPPCTGAFVSHPLDFTTTVNGRIHTFDSNGSGVAAADLDDDGLADLVFANLDGPSAIFWNQGNFRFRKQELADASARGVALVDVDGDGRLDIIFTHRNGGVSRWQNLGGGYFETQPLPGVQALAYSMAWADLNGDGTLDLVTGAYDAEIQKITSSGMPTGRAAGVFVYTQRGGQFSGQQLAPHSQALAIMTRDLNGDRRPDLWVGNDFTVRDQVWFQQPDGWSAAAPFDATAESTMSLDAADVDNDGRVELFASDMKPYAIDTHTLASWLPLMAKLPQSHPPDDPQLMENVLLVQQPDGRYVNQGRQRRVDATGWSWSSKFGDLDNDGFVDLYAVNGMIGAELFAHLPNDELIEQNQALRNDGTGRFAPMPSWRLGATGSGRGMTLVDLNNDGRLDAVVNNLRSPAEVFENRVCGGPALEVGLHWPASQNSRAVGAQLLLETSAGLQTRDVRAGSGYLSGDPPLVHFGLPPDATLHRLTVRWPDGSSSAINDLAPQTLLEVTR